MNTAEIRQSFLDYFAGKGHEVVASSSLVPANDPTLLFTNAGMVQFKETFLGLEKRPYKRAASSQRCVRAGGKHNDLENVGYTARHHTFFEMLGNFSFGDYFKKEAIEFAWEYLTEVIKLSPERLWVTVFDEDDDAADLWLKHIGIDPSRFSRIGAKDNFWSMGDTGPCGPCSEIFYDHGPDVAGGPPGTPDEDGDRYVEIWNLVFMQYDRDDAGKLNPLPKPSVDTGMGLERLAAVLQGVHSNYEIDLFQHLIKAAAGLTGTEDLDNNSLKVIADHIRSCGFLITDGVLPSNEGRGYVLRRIIRRAARHGHQLGMDKPFFYKLIEPLIKVMGDAYPELVKARSQVERVLKQEEERFAETLDKGMALLTEAIEKVEGDVLSGEAVFKLYDTYGFPADLTADVAREHGLKIDMAAFEKAMDSQRERARASSQFASTGNKLIPVDNNLPATEFLGYEKLVEEARVLALFSDGQPEGEFTAGAEGVVVLDRSPFYAESGGQVGDTGVLLSNGSEFVVEDTQKQGDVFLHIGHQISGTLQPGHVVQAAVDEERRQAIVLNHSATHLMHKALQEVLGSHVQQKGSLVTPERLRFDFSHFEPLTAEQIARIEALVNQQIRKNSGAFTEILPIEEAKKQGAAALFGEKYGDEVRVMRIGFSLELCGGTHVNRAGDIGVFKIINETGIASGVRRIEAVTGEHALDWVAQESRTLESVAAMLKSNKQQVAAKVEQILTREKELEKQLETLKSKISSQAGNNLIDQAVDVGGIKVLAAKLEGADPKSLRETVDQLKQKLGRAAVVLAAVNGNKVSLVAGVTKAETKQLKAGELVNLVASKIGGKGGGRPDMAQAGGNDPSQLEPALQQVPDWVSEQLRNL
ncbi:MAG TPA: alanine--tRNA ligase [Chromatiales bacterium]|nr:alanine--tRNA ligase [Chromatiales bacterium]